MLYQRQVVPLRTVYTQLITPPQLPASSKLLEYRCILYIQSVKNAYKQYEYVQGIYYSCSSYILILALYQRNVVIVVIKVEKSEKNQKLFNRIYAPDYKKCIF